MLLVWHTPIVSAQPRRWRFKHRDWHDDDALILAAYEMFYEEYL